VTCTACGRAHLVNAKTGKVLETGKKYSGSLAMFVAILRASSRVSSLAAERSSYGSAISSRMLRKCSANGPAARRAVPASPGIVVVRNASVVAPSGVQFLAGSAPVHSEQFCSDTA
jgi:hypothetical protein